MNDLLIFFTGAAFGAAAFMQYLISKYRVVPKERVTLEWVHYEFPYDHPAKAQIVRQRLYNVTPERHRELTSSEE